MLFSTLRYIYLGWIDTQLVDPLLHFSYYGFEWVKPLPRLGLYLVYTGLSIASIAIALGWYYRFFAVMFFIGFTYVELIDLTYYLNHYYFVSLISFLLIWVPANRYFSLDVRRNPSIELKEVSRWCIGIFKLQIAIVYIYAGLAKLNYDWLFRALPLAIWLPAKTSIPIIGPIFKYKLTAYIFSWAGMLFDTFVIAFLSYRPTRLLAYMAVVFFHVMTGILFPIGIFPLVMIVSVTIFFSSAWHEKIIQKIRKLIGSKASKQEASKSIRPNTNRIFIPFVLLFFCFQLLFPWRYLLYDGNIFWTEEGYRFSWRVMLMEKGGTATFYIKDGPDGREGSVINSKFLNPHQEKQMSMQPDMILQFAHYLADHYRKKGMKNPQIRAEVLVTLNASPAKYLIDPNINLTTIKDGWGRKDWILPFEQPNQK